MSRPRSGRGTGQRVLSRHFCGPEAIARKERDAMKVVTTKGFATTRSTRHATERAEIEVPISTDPYASVRNSSGARNDRQRDDSVAARNELLETLGDIRCERSEADAARTLLLRTVAPRATRRYTGGRAGGKAETEYD